MQIEEIHKLLDRFYKGETSLDEEKRLSDFFRQEVVPKSLEEDRRVFYRFTTKMCRFHPTWNREFPRSLIRLTTIEK